MSARSLLVVLLGVAGCSLSSTSARIEQSQANARALGTVHDFEIARRAHATSLVELEGLHELDPDNQELLYALVRAWVTETELFTTDDLEAAIDREAASEQLYQRRRVESGFTRASFWGREWLSARAPDVNLDAARGELAKALAGEFADEQDAEPLLWLGHALLGASSASEKLRSAAELVLARSIALDERGRFASAHMLLGRKYASESPSDLERSRQHFAKAEALAGNKLLLTQFYHASLYHCRQGNLAEFKALLGEVLRTSDPEPTVRLENAVAKRRAQRWTSSDPLTGSCAFASGPKQAGS
ncbi:MAG TPA: TRAP transporter TatT component family protein [Polyangiaceae bacterium]|nr:TRAP transporter TatT component family protein [Polyangiaceae bacterium]